MLKNYLISPETSVKKAIEILDKNKFKVVFIVNDDYFLEGIFTQGDMRSYILHCNDFTQSIKSAMNPTPITFNCLKEINAFKKTKRLIVYPIVDEKGRLINAKFEEGAIEQENMSDALKDVPLVIMAGGKGTRLYPYTKVLPKALIPIGDYTITERIIKQFNKFGCKKVYLILNHKANMIQAYFNELEKEYDIDYIFEEEFLGTGGGLSLLKGKINSTFILSNCDILINDDLECAYQTHKNNGNKITFVCATKNITIPYGIINTNEKGDVIHMSEKPELSFLTNTGVYVIEPEVIENLKNNEFIHFPNIAEKYIKNGYKVGIFPVSEKSWLDMGQFSEMEHMVKELDVLK